MEQAGSHVIFGRLFLPWHQCDAGPTTVANGATQLLLSGSPLREWKGGGLFIFPRGWDGERLGLPLAGDVHQLLQEEKSVLESCLPGHSEEKSCIVWKA